MDFLSQTGDLSHDILTPHPLLIPTALPLDLCLLRFCCVFNCNYVKGLDKKHFHVPYLCTVLS